MKIDKVINNNVVSVINEQNKELVIMGTGLGFQKKPGDSVDTEKINKIFSLNQAVSDQFKTLLREVDIELMNVVEEIIHRAKTVHKKQLNDIIYVALTDHLNFAIERQQKGQNITNGLLWEIKKLYKDEYAIGLEAIKMIEEKLNILLPEDEAGFIAIHFVNAELNENISNVEQITKVIQSVLSIVKYHFNIDFNEDSLNYFRFITHLKFFAQRLINNVHLKEHDSTLFQMIKQKHPEAYNCVEKIEHYIESTYNQTLSDEEKLYLTIHIERVTSR